MADAREVPECICEFDADTCGGTGSIECSGCGGDLCVCAACHGNGAEECPGCSECGEPDLADWDGEDDEGEDPSKAAVRAWARAKGSKEDDRG